MDGDERLTLGALYRELRQGLGDSGRVRVGIDFQQRTSMVPVVGGLRMPSRSDRTRRLTADLDYVDQMMHRAEVTLHQTPPEPAANFVVRHHRQGYVYSLDGERWERFTARPRVFDLAEFEAELARVTVNDVMIDQAILAGGPRQALDIDVERFGFERMLRF